MAEKEKRLVFDPEEYSLRKRLPRHLSKQKTDIYINSKTDFVGQLKRCQKLLESGETEICIHGLGSAVNRAVNIALALKSKYLGTLILSPKTSTVNLIDDIVPETDDGEAYTHVRNNSAIHIKVFHPTLDNSQS